MTDRTIRRHLTDLERHRLAERTADGWIRGPADVDAVADEIGTAGMTLAQRRLHEGERHRYSLARAAYAQAVNSPPTVIDFETGEVLRREDLLRERPA